MFLPPSSHPLSYATPQPNPHGLSIASSYSLGPQYAKSLSSSPSEHMITITHGEHRFIAPRCPTPPLSMHRPSSRPPSQHSGRRRSRTPVPVPPPIASGANSGSIMTQWRCPVCGATEMSSSCQICKYRHPSAPTETQFRVSERVDALLKKLNIGIEGRRFGPGVEESTELLSTPWDLIDWRNHPMTTRVLLSFLLPHKHDRWDKWTKVLEDQDIESLGDLLIIAGADFESWEVSAVLKAALRKLRVAHYKLLWAHLGAKPDNLGKQRSRERRRLRRSRSREERRRSVSTRDSTPSEGVRRASSNPTVWPVQRSKSNVFKGLSSGSLTPTVANSKTKNKRAVSTRRGSIHGYALPSVLTTRDSRRRD